MNHNGRDNNYHDHSHNDGDHNFSASDDFGYRNGRTAPVTLKSLVNSTSFQSDTVDNTMTEMKDQSDEDLWSDAIVDNERTGVAGIQLHQRRRVPDDESNIVPVLVPVSTPQYESGETNMKKKVQFTSEINEKEIKDETNAQDSHMEIDLLDENDDGENESIPIKTFNKESPPHIDLTTGCVSRRRSSIEVVDKIDSHHKNRSSSRWNLVKSIVTGSQSSSKENLTNDVTIVGDVNISKRVNETEQNNPELVNGLTYQDAFAADSTTRMLCKKKDGTVWTKTTNQYRVCSKQNMTTMKKKSMVRYYYLWWNHRITNSFSDHIRWIFRISFVRLIGIAFRLFIILSLIFTMIIFWIAQYQPECIYAGGSGTDFVSNGGDWVDAFQLSWTTLATVGYGIVAPQTPTQYARCVGVNMLMAIESFIGVLFGSVTGALMISKIARIQSVALVQFSYPICVRYGKGLLTRGGTRTIVGNKVDDSSCSDDDEEVNTKYPCPILEFRIINQMSTERGGEIRNASVNVVACTDASSDEDNVSTLTASPALASSLDGKSHNSSKMLRTASVATMNSAATRAGKFAASVVLKWKRITVEGKGSLQRNESSLSESTETTTESTPVVSLNEGQLNQIIEAECKRRIKEQTEKDAKALRLEKLKHSSITMCEGNPALIPPRVYQKLEIDTDTHPFFKRVWNIRHVLDAQSPLLTGKARAAIERNNGYWPSNWNDNKFVREHLRFKQIIVSFRGTANVSANSVYAQKVYEYEQVAVGYTFANVVFLENGVMAVDETLLNDIKEQFGGGAEPLDDTGAYEESYSLKSSDMNRMRSLQSLNGRT